jgi:N-acetylglucosamine-6-phosphate deacetylase
VGNLYLAAMQFYSADKIFTGYEWLQNHAVAVNNNRIEDILPLSAIKEPVKYFDNSIIAPAFIDLQIYGAGGKLLAVYPEKDSLIKLVDYCRSGGAAYCMPTVATNTYDTFYNSIDAIKDYWNSGGEGVLGLHIEGPWISIDKRGAHIAEFIHTPTLRQVKELLEYGKGVIKIITLAAEVCNKEIIDCILPYGVVISAGHSNATYDEATMGFNNGIVAATHLYNAMSPLQHRSPGMVGAIMDHSSVMSSIIPDGHHVDYAAIRIAKQVMKERLFAITDAVTETASGSYPHQLAGDKYESSGILSGSALTMAKAVKNLMQHCHIDLAEAFRMCSLYPARVMGLQNRMGCIKKDYEAALVVMDNSFNVITLL